MVVLVVNAGSSSLKMDVIDSESEATLASGLVERIGAVTSLSRFAVAGEKPRKKAVEAPDHGAALDVLLGALKNAQQASDEAGVPLGPIEAVGHRVVHGGESFSEAARIDDEVKEAIRDAYDLAPLHNPANLRGIEAAEALFPDLPQVAVFDTAFHQTLPPEAYLYALPNRLYRRHKIRRYGFHGPSHRYVSRRAAMLAGLPEAGLASGDTSAPPSRVITLHLGNGCSACAVLDGQSIDTSMGATPLEGLVMGTRCGDLDPSLVFELVELEEASLGEIHAMLNRYSGLLGLSGYAADMRDLMAEAASGDRRCQQAIDVFCHRAKSYIGRYM
ncbi:MAG: acetate/propionate family kinase, partial [Bacteroidota bacterium]